MKCHVLIPNLFLPASEFKIDPLPNLETLISRGERTRLEAKGFEEWIFNAFDVAKQQDWPAAALHRAEPGYWLRADPVHLQLRRDWLALLQADIAQEEAGALVDSLNRHFEVDGLRFHIERPDAWLLRLPDAIDLVTVPLSQAMGRNVDDCLPEGTDAMRMAALMNEIQMLFHDHPANSDRDFPVNSVWFWGGGISPEVKPSGYASVSAGNVLASIIANRAGSPCIPVPENAGGWLSSLAEGEHLVILEDLMLPARYGDGNEWDRRLRRLDASWFGPLLEAVKNGLDLSIIDNEIGVRFDTKKHDLWKFWKRARPVLDCLK